MQFRISKYHKRDKAHCYYGKVKGAEEKMWGNRVNRFPNRETTYSAYKSERRRVKLLLKKGEEVLSYSYNKFREWS